MTFHVDLSPTDLNINRDNLHIMDYLLVPTKFKASEKKHEFLDLSVA